MRHRVDARAKRLADRFVQVDCEKEFAAIWDTIVCWEEDGAKKYFSPFVPFIGDSYDRTGILIYATAQNLASWPELREKYARDPEDAPYRLYVEQGQDIKIQPYDDGVLPALGTLCHYARTGTWITESISEAKECLAATNFFKFSLWKSKPGNDANKKQCDLNPDKLDQKRRHQYIENTFSLFIEYEVEVLQPKVILALEPGYSKLSNCLKKAVPVFPINDPAWLKRGGSGKLKPGKRMYEETKSEKDDAVDNWLNTIINKKELRYYSRDSQIFYYLRYYFCKFARFFRSQGILCNTQERVA